MSSEGIVGQYSTGLKLPYYDKNPVSLVVLVSCDAVRDDTGTVALILYHDSYDGR